MRERRRIGNHRNADACRLYCADCRFMALACALFFERGIHLEAAEPVHWAIIVYLALACTVAGYLLQNAALESLSSRLVALLQCVCPVMTALFSFLLLGERLSAAGLIGAAILLGCVAAETLIREDGEP